MSFIESNGLITKTHSLDSIDQLASVINNRCGIPKAIVLESIQGLQMTKDSWS